MENTLKYAFVYNLLLIIETLHFLSFAFDGQLKFIWQQKSIKLIPRMFELFSLETALRQGNYKHNANNLYLATVMNTLVLLLSTAMYISFYNATRLKKSVKESSSTLVSYCTKLCALMLILMRTCLTYPALQCIYSFFFCGGGSPYFKLKASSGCYSSSHLGHVLLSVGNFVCMLGLMVFNFMLVNDFNPTSEIPFAGFCNNNWVFKIIMKFVIPLLSIIDYNVRRTHYSEFLV